MAGARGAKERGDGPGAGGQEGVFHRLLCSEKASKVPITSQLSGQGGGILGKVYLFFLNKRTLILLLITKQYLLSIKKRKRISYISIIGK